MVPDLFSIASIGGPGLALALIAPSVNLSYIVHLKIIRDIELREMHLRMACVVGSCMHFSYSILKTAVIHQ